MLDSIFRHADAFLTGLDARPVGLPVDPETIRGALARELPEEPMDATAVLDELVAAVQPGLVGSAGPRYFGFVTGQALPAAMGADMLAAVWDQNAFSYVSSPAAAVVEEVAERWVLDVLGLPAGASVGFVTGAQMANATCLATARNTVLARLGWDVAERGLIGAPPLRVIAGEEAHATIFSALRFIGLAPPERLPVDGQGAIDASALELDGPAIVCAQAGNVNTGEFDPLDELAARCREAGAWLHVDGAFGLWAAASPALRGLVAGAERADSWATDAHKWLNVPYDSGIVILRDASRLRATMSAAAGYLPGGDLLEPSHHTPQSSQRARAVDAWAALRSLGRSGVADLVDRTSDHAARFAAELRAAGHEVLNDVVINQVLVRFGPDDASTDRVIERVQHAGVCWCGPTTWRGRRAMRISVSSWATTTEDVTRSVRAILEAAAAERPR